MRPVPATIPGPARGAAGGRRARAVPGCLSHLVHLLGPAVTGPRVSVNVTPELAVAGDLLEVLAMVSNPSPLPMGHLWLGLVLPGCAQIGTVVPPAGSAALPDRCIGPEVLRCPLPDLAPGASAGLDVQLRAPDSSGRFGLTAFVTVDVDPAYTLTATRVLPVL